MRTKVLICAAALAAASAFTSMAQNVYSLNIVGYINIPLVDGFNLVANQLDFDGTGLNNTPANILGTNLPVNTAIYGWAQPGSWNIAAYTHNRSTGLDAWGVSAGSMPTLNPGQGFWLSIPPGGSATINSNLTVVGQVDQGAGFAVNTNLATPSGFSLLSSIVPMAGRITSDLDYSPVLGDTVYQWNTSPAGWTINNYVHNRALNTNAWSLSTGPTGAPDEPTFSVGEGFWLASGVGASWSNYFDLSSQ